MRIIIDMQGAQTESRYRGIGRYTLSLVLAIIRNNRDHEIILALNGLFTDTIEPIRTLFNGLVPQENIRLWYTPFPTREAEVGNEQRQQIAKQIREAFLISLQPDIVLISSLFEGWSDDAVTDVGTFDDSIAFATILYDLIPLINPDQSVRSNERLQAFFQNKAGSLKRSNGFLAISASARQEALDHEIGSEERIYNISTACDDIFKKVSLDSAEQKKLLKKLGITGSFIMYTGGSDERKNLYRLIEAYAQLPAKLRKAHKLVFVGRMPREFTESFVQLAKTVGIDSGGLIFTGYVSEDELVKLYNCCKLFVFPSLHEGFGLPPLEAMACGAPVIVANATSLPEVAACKESMFDPYSIESIKQKMEHVLTDEVFCSTLIEKGLEHVKTFSWDESAKKALEMLQRTFNAHQEAVSGHHSPERPDRIISRLITSIANGDGPKLADNQRAMVAQAIALSIPAANSSKTLFVDISCPRQIESKTENQQNAAHILQTLLANPPTGYSITPVYAQVDSEGYLYAEAPFSHINNAEIIGTPIEFSAGDVFLGLEPEFQVVPAQQAFLQRMRNNGVTIKFIVYDLLRLSMPKNYASGSTEVFTDWLTTITRSDGVICLSEEVAQQFSQWLQQQKNIKNERFNVDWFPVAASEESSDVGRLSLTPEQLFK